MNLATKAQLRAVGMQLDAGSDLHVFGDGVLALKRSIAGVETLGAENCHEQSRTSGSAAGSWQGASGWQGSAGRSWTPGEAEPPCGGSLCENYLGQLDELFAAYPRTAVWTGNEGMWLAVESSVLTGLDRWATFLIAVPFRSLHPVRAWAFWTTPADHVWIGPRHTNAIDGSICAFNPAEGTWRTGGNLIELIDQYTKWAFCHLHLETLRWWPGRQTAEYVYERLIELKDNEWCGCRPESKRYADCCKQSDLAADRFRAAIEFVGRFLKYKPRQPPASVSRLMSQRGKPPPFQTAAPDPFLFVGSCLYPARIGVGLSDAAKWAMPRTQ